ncbi:MAG: hypothetical protein Q9220_006766 [cf. Caloplaca sp. 1 TL-2023]
MSGGKGSSKSSSSSKTVIDNADPLDFSDLEAKIEDLVVHLREELRGIRPGGISAEAVEDVRVVLKSGGGGGGGGGGGQDKGKGKGEKGGTGPKKEIVRVRDLAQVVQRGRTMVVMAGEKEHLKPLTSALASSPLSLTPLPPSPSSLAESIFEVHIPIPPTTQESRHAAINTVTERGKHADFNLREARGSEKKRLRQLKLKGVMGPDLNRKAELMLDKVAEKGAERLKGVVEEKRRGLGGGGA